MAFDAREKIDNVLQNASKMVFGQDWMLEAIMAALICEGHLLIEGMPGLGKTLAVSVFPTPVGPKKRNPAKGFLRLPKSRKDLLKADESLLTACC